MTLDATIGGASANSFVTQARGTALLSERLYTSVWTAASSGDKDAALVWATTLLDQSFSWNGYYMTTTQRLRWPRGGVFGPDGLTYPYDAIPEPLERATAELALILLSRDLTAIPELLGQGFSDVSVGPLRVAVDPKAVLPLIPPQIVDSLSQLGASLLTSPSGGQVKLVRA